MVLPVFPATPRPSFSFKRTPIWSTLKQESWSGKSNPIGLWSYPRRRYTLAFQLLRSDPAYIELQQLEGFFNSVGGSAGLFAFNDLDDNAVTGFSFGTGDGVTTKFQLSRSWGGVSEPVTCPTGTPVIYNGGSQTTGYAVGANPGQIVFSSAPANGAALTWSGAYAWPCRFDDDTIDFDKFMVGLWSVGSIAFTTVKL